MNISGLKGLIVAGALLVVSTPQVVEAKSSECSKPTSLCEEKKSEKAKAEGCEKKAEAGCEKGEKCCKEKKVSELPADAEKQTANADAEKTQPAEETKAE